MHETRNLCGSNRVICFYGDRCFDLWHQTEDLEKCSKDANTRLQLQRKNTEDTHNAQMSKRNAQKSGNIRAFRRNSFLQNRDESPGSMIRTGAAAAGDTNAADTSDANIENDSVMEFAIRTCPNNSLLQNRDESPGAMIRTDAAAAGETNTADTSDANIENDSVREFSDIDKIVRVEQV